MKIIIVSLILLSVLSIIKSEDCVSVYKIDKEQCGELCLNKYIADFAIKFGGVKAGTCKENDYTVFDHTETISVGPFGNYEVFVYRKEGESPVEGFLQESIDFVDVEILPVLEANCETVHKIGDNKCGELCLYPFIASYAKNELGYADGACKDVDFTVYDHIETIPVGPFDNFDMKIYIRIA